MLTNEVIELRKVLVNANENHKALKEKIDLGFTIFSKDYTSSPRCLEELTKIMECVDNKGQEFFFVFHKVKPSDGLSPIGTFEADIKGFDLEKVQRWKDALRIADDMAGSRDYFVGVGFSHW
ncbi:protein PHLOEM PROTEIN 2-LIKE A8-like [Solanum stenotomum]|uniref:protein PHLOEM PROTEIN 2-LIKE A8-like n=1 Tax=Solanum stenotomum TaxID=172797 RepID=UPI0020D15078|nr:protein PHLOEM PROTEIN 2-LIKE A8-like [Solanum stenotomum]